MTTYQKVIKTFPRAVAVAALAGAAVVAGAGLRPALAATVNCGDVVTADVVLDADLNCSGTGLVIGASGVTIDLNGHTVSGSGSGTGIVAQGGWRTPFTDLVVRNGRVRGFATGAHLEFTQNVELNDLRMADNGTGGSGVYATALSLYFSKDVKVVNSTLRAAGAATVVVRDTRGVSVTGSRILDGPFALSINSNDVSVTDSTFRDAWVNVNQTGGVSFTGNRLVRSRMFVMNSYDPEIRGNRISGAEHGVQIETGTPNAVVAGNVFTGNGIGLRIDPPTSLHEVQGAVVQNNVFRDNRAAGMFLEVPVHMAGNPLTISGNVFRRNGHDSGDLLDAAGRPVDDGLHINVPAGSAVTVTGNRTAGNADHGIEAQPGTVQDGGGNISVADPNGCLGVVCAP